MEQLKLSNANQHSDAVISECGQYRYALERTWSEQSKYALFIGLNPSTADASLDDPTIRRCIGFAIRFGCSGLLMGNLFALRSTAPSALSQHHDAIGPENDAWLRHLSERAFLTIFAWGAHKLASDRAGQISSIFRSPYCLGLTVQGHPRHPLYLKKTAELFLFSR